MDYFSISAFILSLREVLEAALIIGIILAYLKRTNNTKYNKQVWLGVLIAILASVVGAVIIFFAFGGFEGKFEKIFEGIVMMLAAALLTWMIIWMFEKSFTIIHEFESKIELAIDERARFGLIIVSFIAVFREGIELILFLYGISVTEERFGVMIGAIAGVLIAIIMGIIVFKSTRHLNINKFFNITSIILIIAAAGIFTYSIHEFQELGIFGPESESWNVPLWDWSNSFSDKEGFGAILRALVGYQDKPTTVEIIAYGFYWVFILKIHNRIHSKFKPKLIE